ncbi:MAG: CarD family transcriptional regulator [Aestuariivirga sp.]|uniref:CarD family transcriptional regulator n=1 Tax=Aestuariivirga sp. TaxID=2650926 RepID=UPI0038D1B070
MTKKSKTVTAKKPQAKAKAKSAPKNISKPAAAAKAKPVAKAQAKAAPARPVAKAQAKAAPAKPVPAKPAAAAKPEARKAAVKPAPAPAPKAAAAQPAAAAPAAAKPAAAPVSAAPAVRKLMFKVNELVVYPAHGVGRISQIEEQEIAGAKLELYIVDFEKEKLRLKVPTSRAEQKGMRRLSDKTQIEAALKTLRGRARIKRTMWSRRAQEYDAKINSGDIMAVAEVVRDLYRSDRQPEQSYSERQLFEQALDRMAREIAAVKKIDDDQAVKELEDYLAKNAKRPGPGEKAEDDVATEQAA